MKELLFLHYTSSEGYSTFSRGTNELLNGASANKSLQMGHCAGLIIRARVTTSTKGLLSHSGASALGV